MGYAERLPSPALRSLVSCLWTIRGEAKPHRVLPDGCIDILVTPSGHARVVGTMERAIVAPASSGSWLGIRFLPGEASRLLPEASRELTDTDALLTDLWGDDARRLEDALSRTDLRAVEQLLMARLTAPVDHAVRRATRLLAANGRVRDAAVEAGLSERQLTRRFRERVGTAPKTFARVMRLLRARDLLGQHDLAEVAVRAGYADQSHFTRDAAELAGATPARLANEMSDSFNTDDAAAE